MQVVVPKEGPGERRVALVPESVGRLADTGLRFAVQAGAGGAAGFPDAAYAEAGATIVDDAAVLYRDARVVVRVRPPAYEAPADDVARLPADSILIAFLQPLTSPGLIRALAARRVSALAMELVPRITRAQRMDALSSQATVAGYRAVLDAATELPRFFPMLMTAAGTIPPAKVLVIGAGVAGLQAIATARRLGAVVMGFDIRPVVKEQVESLGAQWVGMPMEEAEGAGGYAKEVAEEQQRRLIEHLHGIVPDVDVIITTAQIPGRPAPRLITDEMVAEMRVGAVIVDLAAESGGNCTLTRADERVERGGVTILGPTNLASTLPYHASQMYSRNVMALLQHLVADGAIRLDVEDEIIRDCLVTHGGDIVNERARAAAGATA
jgi:NAD(P) transhydrogenase subunit alpha